MGVTLGGSEQDTACKRWGRVSGRECQRGMLVGVADVEWLPEDRKEIWAGSAAELQLRVGGGFWRSHTGLVVEGCGLVVGVCSGREEEEEEEEEQEEKGGRRLYGHGDCRVSSR
jgi:hypothetical protein